MTELTREEYMTKTQEDYSSGVSRPKFDKDAKFKLKGQLHKELRDHTFCGSKNEDANEHIKSILDIVDLFTTPDVTMDQLMLCVFPITLTGAARLDVPTRQIIDSKGGVPTMKADDAKKAIQEMADYSQKWHNGISTRNKSTNTSDGLAVIQAQLNNLGRQIKKEEGKILKEAYYTQFGVPFSNSGRYRATASGFYQRDNRNPSYQERRPTMEESLSKFMIQIEQMSKVLQERGFESLLSSTETNLRDHVKSITTTEEADTTLIRRIGPNQYAVSSLREDGNMPLIELSRTSVPFPGHLKEKIYDEKEILMKLKKLQVNSTKPAKTLRRLLKEKSWIEEEMKATMH
ncbi:hypothetical protein Tco_0727223 [Tanacetum coccineum]|uniref:Uncharacterized protein n=1 Tax=Tanacetum coccineum TaxID=301880 RepID=A0ABQ4YIN0_9ASTR